MASPIIPERRPPTPPRRCTPIIVISPTTSAEDPPYAPQSPSPGEYAHYQTMAGDSTWAATYKSPPLPPMTILGMPILQHPQPQSAQTSSGTILPFHTMPTSQRPAMAHLSTEPLPQHQPISNIKGLPRSGTNQPRPHQHPPELVRAVEEPIASTSTLPPTESSYWTNITEQRAPLRPRRHQRRWEQIDRQLRSEPQPPRELLAPPESRYEYITDETSGEGTLFKLPRPFTPFPDMTPFPGGIPESEPSPSRRSRQEIPALSPMTLTDAFQFYKRQLQISVLLSRLN